MDEKYDDRDCGRGVPPTSNCCEPKACREKTGREYLIELAHEYKELAMYLESLARAIPEEMSYQACRGLRLIIAKAH